MYSVFCVHYNELTQVNSADFQHVTSLSQTKLKSRTLRPTNNLYNVNLILFTLLVHLILHIITSSQPLFSLSPSITSSAFHVPGLNPIMFHESFPSFIAFLVPFGLPSVHRSWTWTGVTRQWRLFVLVCLFYLFFYFWLRVLDQTILTVVFSVHVKLSVYRIVWYRMHQEIVHDFYRHASQTICCSLTLAGLEGAPGVRSFFRNLYTVTGGKFWHQQIFKHHCTCPARSSFFSERVVDIWNTLPPSKVDFSSLVKFKRSLKLLDLSQYLVCT